MCRSGSGQDRRAILDTIIKMISLKEWHRDGRRREPSVYWKGKDCRQREYNSKLKDPEADTMYDRKQ